MTTEQVLWIVEQARVLAVDEGPSVAEALNLRGWRGRSKRVLRRS